MCDQPEGANARNGKALLALSVGLLTLELNLSLNGNGPGLPRAAAQHVSAPVLAIGRLARLLGQSIPARRAGSDEALCLEVEMQIAFSAALGRMPGRMGKEPGSQARDFGDGSPSALGHPRIALFRGSEPLPLVVTYERRDQRFSRLRIGEQRHGS